MNLQLGAARREFRRQRKEWLPIASLVLLAFSVVLGLAGITTNYRSNSVSDPSLRSYSSVPDSLLSTVSVRSSGYPANYCKTSEPSNFLGSRNKVWLLLLLPAVVFMFIGLAIVTDDYFVPALERICEQLQLSDDVAGATFMAAGSSAPELFTSLLGALWTKDDVGIGTIVGSAVFNILIIIGLSAALAGSTLALDPRPLLRDSSFYVVSIVLLMIIVLVWGGPGRILWQEGLILILVYVIYILFMKFVNKRYMKWTKKFLPKKAAEESVVGNVENGNANAPVALETSATGTQTTVPVDPAPSNPVSTPTEAAPTAPANTQDSRLVHPTNAEQSSPEPVGSRYTKLNPRSHFRVLTYAVILTNQIAIGSEPSEAADPVVDGAGNQNAEVNTSRRELIPGVREPKSKLGFVALPLTAPWGFLYRFTIVDCSKDVRKKWWPLTFAVSIIWIMAISFCMVEATRLAGCFIGIPSAVMGLTFLAAGTSVPDALASVAVARNGFGNMAVSNAIGSNVFDILLGLGLPWFIADLVSIKTTVTVKPITLIVVPIVILFAIILVLVGILSVMKWQLSPKVGYILFGLYGLFITYSLLDTFVFNPAK